MFNVRSTSKAEEYYKASTATSAGSISIQAKTPRPHQIHAIDDIYQSLSMPKMDVRAQAHMACGTGKTLVGLWASESLGKQTMLCEPTLNLISQNIQEWKQNYTGERPRFLAVCSDSTVGRHKGDEPQLSPGELNFKVTSSPSEVRRFLSDTNFRNILVSTYHSMKLVAESLASEVVPSFSCIVADEGHVTAGRHGALFSLVHNQEQIRSRTRLYLTATPKIVLGDKDEEVISMDDPSIFGPVAHRLTFGAAVEKGLISDYQLVVAVMNEDDAHLLHRGSSENPESAHLLSAVALLKVAKEHNLSKIVTFQSRVRRAEDFASCLRSLQGSCDRTIWAQAVSGKQSADTRQELLTRLGHFSRDTLAVVSNAKVLTVGANIPTIDGIAFNDPKSSQMDVVQALGRAIRKSDSKPLTTILAPVILPKGVEPEEALEGAGFRAVIQVLRALRAHDERFESRIRKFYEPTGARNQANSEVPAESCSESKKISLFGLTSLSQKLLDAVRTKVVRIGLGLRRPLLTEEMIIKAAKEYFTLYKKLPTQDSKEPVPGMEGESWSAIQSAGFNGTRGLTEGRTLSKILSSLRSELGLGKENLTEEQIICAAREYFKLYSRLPNQHSDEAVPGMEGSTWRMIHSAGYEGLRGLNKGRTLSKILEPLRKELRVDIQLSTELVLSAAKTYYELHQKWPTSGSKQPVPGLIGETWGGIDSAGRKGFRGLPKGCTLSKIIEPLRTSH